MKRWCMQYANKEGQERSRVVRAKNWNEARSKSRKRKPKKAFIFALWVIR